MSTVANVKPSRRIRFLTRLPRDTVIQVMTMRRASERMKHVLDIITT